MTRLNILKNRRLLTFILLGVTLLFGGLAVFLAIAINNRTVNPDDTNAARSCSSQENNYDLCIQGDPSGNSCGDIKRDRDECREARNCEESGKVYFDGRCVDNDTGLKNPGDTCSASSECNGGNTPSGECKTATACSNGIKTCGGETPANGCNSTGGGDGTPAPVDYKRCNVYNDAKDCDPGTQKWIAVFAKECNGTSAVGTPRTVPLYDGACVAIDVPAPVVEPTLRLTPTSAPTTGWAYPNAACRYIAGGGSCAHAEFANTSCNPGENEMCVCGGTQLGSTATHRYYTSVAKEPIKCLSGYPSVEALCAEQGPGIHYGDGTSCGNTYRCPDTVPPPSVTPTPLCLPSGGCDYASGNFVARDCNGKVITSVPDEQCKVPTCKKDEGCDSKGNWVKTNCDGSIASSVPDKARCGEDKTPEPEALCSSLRADKTSYTAGETINLTAKLSKDTGTPNYPNFGYRIQIYNTGVDYAASTTYKNQTAQQTCGSALCTGTASFALPQAPTSNTFLAAVVAYNLGTDNVDRGVVTSSCKLNITVNDKAKVPVACNALTVTRNGTVLKATDQVNPGDILKLNVAGSAGSTLSHYAYDDGKGVKIIKGTGAYNDFYGANKSVDFKVPSTVTAGSTISFSASAGFKINPAGQVATTCANGDCSTDGSNVILCGGTGGIGRGGNQIFKRDTTVSTPQPVIDPVTGVVTTPPLNYKSYSFTDGSRQNLERQLAFSCTDAGLCVQQFKVSTVAQSACSNLTVTNTRTGQSCSGANKAACATLGVKQGDTLTATVAGTGNITGYSLSQSYLTAANTSTSSLSPTQASANFSIPIQRTTELKSMNLIANTTNGVATSTSTSCNLGFSFSNTPTITKVINPGASGNLLPGNVVTSASIVAYDVTVSNTGSSVKNNVIVVDRLSAFDPANNGAAVNPPFGDIILAPNLDRSGGTVSTPASVAPRAIFNASGTQIGAANPGNTYTPGPAGQAVKTVEWNRITTLSPGETFKSQIKVDIGAFTGNPTLRNTVCLYNDTNNNGVYNPGIDTQIACNSKDVFTQTPTFTVEKTSDVDTVEVGNPVTYTITLKNTSASALDLSNMTVVDTIDPDKIESMDITAISNNGTLANNVITWSSANLIAANGGATLAAGDTIDLTFKATPDETIFSDSNQCSTEMINNVEAKSTTPNYTTTGSTVTVNVTKVCITVTPTEQGYLPPTGTDTPLYLPLIGIGLVATAGAVFVYRKKILRRGGRSLEKTLRSQSPEQTLRSKIRMRK